MTPAAPTPPPPDPDTEEYARQYVNEAVHPLVDGLTDPNAISWRDASDASKGLEPNRGRAVSAVTILEHGKRAIRSAVRNSESSSAKAARKAERDAKIAGSKGKLYKGQYLHGSMDGQVGAARRGCPCTLCEAARATDASVKATVNAAIDTIYLAFQKIEKMEWTWRLLNSSFSLGRRVSVTWADATVEEHEQRIELIEKPARGSLQTAARHRSAIDTIVAARAVNLREAVAKGYTT